MSIDTERNTTANLCFDLYFLKDFVLLRVALPVISRQSSPPFAGVKATAHVTHRRFAYPRFTSILSILTGLLVLTPPLSLLTPFAWDILFPGRATIESVNSWREGFRGARTGSGGPVIGP